MGVPIDFEGGIGILPRSADPAKRAAGLYWALGRIRYSIADPSTAPGAAPGARDGWLLYIKPAFCGTEPPDVCEYAMAHDGSSRTSPPPTSSSASRSSRATGCSAPTSCSR